LQTVRDVHARVSAATDLDHLRVRDRPGVYLRDHRPLRVGSDRAAPGGFSRSSVRLLRARSASEGDAVVTHSHEHHHDSSAYYTEQLCTSAICGAMGGIAIALHASGGLNVLLKEGILTYSVLAGGITLLVLVAVRAVALWITVGQPEAACNHDHDNGGCGHNHEHGHAAAEDAPEDANSAHEHHHHDHDHSHAHGHSHGGHDHAHDHSWTPIRYIVLLLPVLLYFFVPLNALSTARGYEGAPLDPAWASAVQATGDLGELAFRELDGAANVESRRKQYDGKIARLTGQFVPSPSSNQFSLVRMKIRCCAADAVPLPFPILVDGSLAKELPSEQQVPNAEVLNRKWVEVTCQILFRPHPERPSEWITLLVVRPTKKMPISDLIKQTPPDPNPYL